MKFISKKLQNTGFSLLEIIIAIAIIGIMITIFAAEQSKNRGKKALNLGTEQVANDIRSARSYSFDTASFNGGPPAGGYGIHFDENSNSYFIFGDKNSDLDYDDGEKYQTVELSNSIKIAEGGLKIIDGGTTTPSSVDIVFTSPYGVTYIDGSDAAGRKLEITATGLAGDKIIKVDVSGKID